MNCSTCGHSQPEGLYCANCGGDLAAGLAPPPRPFEGTAPILSGPVADGSETRHFATEGHILALGFWFRCVTVLGLVYFGQLLFSDCRVLVSGDMRSEAAVNVQLMLDAAYVVGLVLCLLVHWLGLALQRFSDRARTISAYLAGVSIMGLVALLLTFLGIAAGMPLRGGLERLLMGLLLAVSLILAWQVAVAVVLCSTQATEVCSPAYRDFVARSPGLRAHPYTSWLFWIPFVPVLLALAYHF